MSRLAPQTGPDIPRAQAGALSTVFWEGCRRGELLFQRCACCGKANFVPVERCRGCLAAALGWERSRGLASLYSWTVVSRPASPAFSVPYVPAIVTLDEGYRMMSGIVGCELSSLRTGLRLRVAFHAVDETLTLPYFEPC